MFKNQFCLIWKSESVSFYKPIEELNLNVNVFDCVLSDKHSKCFIKNDYKPKKVQSHLTNMVV